MAIDFKNFVKISQYVLDIQKPLMLRGRHGIGKSELVYQIAANRGLPVIERRISQMSEGDLLGLPVVNGNSTAWNPPDWFKTAMEKPCVLFLDEVDRGSLEVRQGIFQLTDSHALNGHKLHKDTLIIAACNGGTHGAQYQVASLDPAELDRWTVFDVEPTVQDWLDWAAGKVHPLVFEFISGNKPHLEFIGEFEPNKKYPSRRSWVRLNNALVAANLLEERKANAGIIYNLATGFVGFEAAVSLRDFVEKYEDQVSVEDILDKGQHGRTKAFSIQQHVVIVDKILESGRCDKALKAKEMQNLADYFIDLPAEVALKLFDGLSKRLSSPIPANTIKMHKMTSTDGRSCNEKIASFWSGKSN
jgi:midasin (ATPase involved in ribosome maturation)